MGFDPNYRILRSIIPDPQDPKNDLETDFKVPIHPEKSGLSLMIDICSLS